MGQLSSDEVTQLLRGWHGGDRESLDALLPVVYKELRRIAHFQLRKEREDHSLQSAELVNEAYLRLVRMNPPQWESRTHFFAVAAHLIRQILVDYARRHGAWKRGAGQGTLPLEDASQLLRGKDIDVVLLDDALKGSGRTGSTESESGRAAFFRRIDLRGDGRGTRRIRGYRISRLEHRASLAPS